MDVCHQKCAERERREADGGLFEMGICEKIPRRTLKQHAQALGDGRRSTLLRNEWQLSVVACKIIISIILDLEEIILTLCSW